MKGTDCTPSQIVSASQFLAARGWPDDDIRREFKREDIVRIVAWYGAMRFQAGRDGVGGTIDRPGEFVTRADPPHPTQLHVPTPTPDHR